MIWIWLAVILLFAMRYADCFTKALNDISKRKQ